MSKKEEKVYMVDFVIRHLWHKMSRMYNQRANDYGVSISVGFILLNVDQEGTPSTQLGPKMGMEPTSLSRTLKTMEEKGLIYREVDTEDKRKVLVFLTKDGLEKRRIARQVVLNFNDRIVSSIPKGKLKTFYEVAERLDMSIDRELSNL
ncbi:MAG: MarR family transcriptional regulator [Crocinitomicaceae bacterium]|nr:MarR family transcriptional regulator [Crocinitomicaceae bacterium]|tara:strand:- start:5420 stop:5866 length:447 start_codon:yes stop_codon:yes gene_type:complete